MSKPGKHKMQKILNYLLQENVPKIDHNGRIMAVGLVRKLINQYWPDGK